MSLEDTAHHTLNPPANCCACRQAPSVITWTMGEPIESFPLCQDCINTKFSELIRHVPDGLKMTHEYALYWRRQVFTSRPGGLKP